MSEETLKVAETKMTKPFGYCCPKIEITKYLILNPYTSSAEKIYKAMIQPVFTYCGTLGLCWSRSRKSRIESIERRSQKVIGGNYQVQTVESLIKRQSCQLVFDCLQDNVCTPFKGYFTKIEHNINTRNNGCSLKLPKAKLEFGRRSFAFQGALVYSLLTLLYSF